MLPGRTDALYLAFRGEMKPELRAHLAARTCEAKLSRTDVSVDVAGDAFSLSQRSRDGWWQFSDGDRRVAIDEGETLGGWCLSVIPDVKALVRDGDRHVLERTRALAEAVAKKVLGERVRRIDLAVDVIGLCPDDFGLRAWQTTRANLRPTIHPVEDENGRVVFRLETIEIGKRGNEVFVRIYDKRAELAAKGDSEKTALEEERWSAAGWNGTDPVLRIEVQVSGDGLKTFGLRDDPDEVLAQRGAIWAYVTRKWLRLVVVGSSTRHKRCKSDERWKDVQAATFDWDGELLSRTRVRGTEKLLRSLSATLSAFAGAGILKPMPFKNAHEYVKDWPDAKCALFVEQAMPQVYSRGFARRMAEELIHLKGERGACEAFMEKWNAACARAGTARPTRTKAVA